MIKAHIFVGGEGVTDNNIVQLNDWSKESAINAIASVKGDDWPTEDCSDMFTPTSNITTCADTVQIVSDNLIQAIDDSVDGGQLYIVRV